jgi:hypothetical protein
VYGCSWEDMKETDCQTHIKIKWILKTSVCGLDSIGSEKGPAADLLESDKPSCLWNVGNFLTGELLFKGAPWGYFTQSVTKSSEMNKFFLHKCQYVLHKLNKFHSQPFTYFTNFLNKKLLYHSVLCISAG